MTVVEFFEGISVCDLISGLAINPDKIIFLGDKKPMEEQQEAHKRFIEEQNMKTELVYRSVNRNNLDYIVKVLTDIVETEENCVFDLTGGEDLALVAMGIVFEKYRGQNKVKMHRVNINSRFLTDCDRDGITPVSAAPKITVEDNIMLYGGTVVPYDADDESGTYYWDINDEFVKDIKSMWDICRDNPGLWNILCSIFSEISEGECNKNSGLVLHGNLNEIEAVFKKEKNTFVWKKDLIFALQKNRFIKNFKQDDDGNISLEFKNEQIKKCLTKAGSVLELLVYVSALNVKDKNGKLIYDDALVGVFVDWDTTIHSEKDSIKDTENEIDVVLMKGLIPIFISCKNGRCEDDELYKLETVANRFGGPYAQKVLISSASRFANEDSHGHFVQRAEDMDIQLFENVKDLSADEVEDILKRIQ